MNYKLLVFDFDGTLADTTEGLKATHRHTNVAMGRPEPSDEVLSGVIGGPLFNTYHNIFGYSEEDAKKAIQIYRNWYAENAINIADLYPDMEETLAELKRRGYLLGVATMKAESFVIRMLENLNIKKYFDVIHGVDMNDTHTKASLVTLCMTETESKKEETVLIGDTHHDANGALGAGVDFVAATYGFEFKTPEKLEGINAKAVIDTPTDLLRIF